MAIFKNTEEYKEWIMSQDWYQTIELPSGLVTPGKVATQLRVPFIEQIDFKGKSFLDIGCNSGQYCFTAKDNGADEVVGIDIDGRRIEQAQVLAENEHYDIRFEERDIFDEPLNRRFDIVICIAVVTEIQDTFSAIEHLKQLIGKYALIELSLARPIVYASYSPRWLKGYEGLSRMAAVTEVRKIRGDKWVVDPSFPLLQAMFGPDFKLTRKGKGVRYDLVEVVRVNG